jgi:hypothetical protein
VIRMRVDETKLIARLDKMLPDVHEALRQAVGPLAQEIAADARDQAQAHIRYVGTRPGQYLASIYGGTYDKGNRIGGFVRSGDPLAHLLEHGAEIPAHEILPTVADVLAFEGDAGMIYAKVVHYPGASVPPYPAIEPAFQAAQGKIEDALTRAVKGAV